jgi:hypothetical protein
VLERSARHLAATGRAIADPCSLERLRELSRHEGVDAHWDAPPLWRARLSAPLGAGPLSDRQITRPVRPTKHSPLQARVESSTLYPSRGHAPLGAPTNISQNQGGNVPAHQVEAGLTVLKWMVGFNLAVSVVVLIKVLV